MTAGQTKNKTVEIRNLGSQAAVLKSVHKKAAELAVGVDFSITYSVSYAAYLNLYPELAPSFNLSKDSGVLLTRDETWKDSGLILPADSTVQVHFQIKGVQADSSNENKEASATLDFSFQNGDRAAIGVQCRYEVIPGSLTVDPDPNKKD